MKHNKKRNTAFLYESLIQELTKAIVTKDEKRKTKIIKIIKEHFKKGSALNKDLKLYKSLLEANDLDKEYAKRLMFEVKKDFLFLNRKKVFNEQTKLLKDMNESLSNTVFANFISNYRDIASVGRFFNSEKSSAKNRLILEDQVVSILTSDTNKPDSSIQHVDKLTYKTFVSKFNEAYGNTLNKEQKDLLTNYITSFTDNGLGLKTFLNEEVGRLKVLAESCLQTDLIKNNDTYSKNMNGIVTKLTSFVEKPISFKTIQEVFYIQNLLVEISKDAN